MTLKLKLHSMGLLLLFLAQSFQLWSQDRICFPESTVRKTDQLEISPTGTFAFKNLGENEDFPNLEIVSLHEDQRGNIWIGLMIGGVLRYNGQELEHIRIDALKTHSILDIAEDNNGNIWFATFGGGLVSYDGSCYEVWDEETGGLSDHVMCLYRHVDDKLYAGTNGDGIIDLSQDKPVQVDWDESLKNAKVWDMCSDGNGGVYLGLVKNGMIRYDGSNIIRWTEDDGLPDGTVRSLYLDKNKTLWIATNSGVASLDPKNDSVLHYEIDLPKQVFCIGENQDGIWFGSNFNGLILKSENGIESFGRNDGLSSERIKSMIFDHEGRLWIGSLGGGVQCLEQAAFRNYNKQSGLDESAIAVLPTSNGNILVSTQSQGIFIKEQNEFSRLDLLDEINAHSYWEMLETGNRMVFGSDGKGLLILDNRKLFQFDIDTEYGNRVLSLAHDSEGSIYVGGYNGIRIIHSSKGLAHITVPELKGVEIWDIFIDQGDNVWVGTDNEGLWYFDRADSTLKKVDHAEIGSYSVNHIAQKEKNEILLSLEDKGLASYKYTDDPLSGEFRIADVADEFDADIFSSIVLDDQVYLGTNKGIIQLDTALQFQRRFDRNDGLRSVQASMGKVSIDQMGHIWWPTEKYLLEFDPESYRELDQEPETYIEHIGLMSDSESDWNSIASSEERRKVPSYWSSLWTNYISFDTLSSWNHLPEDLELSHDQNRLVFHFRSNTWSAEERIEYAYKIEGLDEDWILAGNESKAEYSRIPDGNHTFRVRSRINSGNWGPEATYSFSIAPPVWSTGWFRSILIFCLAGLLFLAYKWRVRQLEKEKAELEDKVAERTAELVIEKDKSESLLLNILPQQTAEELKSEGKANTRFHSEASVLFSDFKGFTMLTETITAQELIETLDDYFKAFDESAEKYGVEKIKTIGDAYMCACGIPAEKKGHSALLCAFGLEMLRLTSEINKLREQNGEDPWQIRIGIHSGPVIAGVVGKKKFAYDIWGDSVNTAARMESSGEVGMLNISKTTADQISDYFKLTSRGEIAAKNKGKLEMYFVEGFKEEYCLSGDARVPNDAFFEVFKG